MRCYTVLLSIPYLIAVPIHVLLAQDLVSHLFAGSTDATLHFVCTVTFH
jgi:hypothetical protein